MTEFELALLKWLNDHELSFSVTTCGKERCCHCPNVLLPQVRTAKDLPEWMNMQDVLKYLSISRTTFFSLKKKGIIIPHKMGGTDYYLPHELDAALRLSIKKGKI